MKTFKLKFSTIQFSNREELMNSIIHLERIRLTQIDYKEYLRTLRLSKEQLRRNAYDRRYAEKSNVEGILPTFEYDSEKFTLDITTEGGLVAAMAQAQNEFSDNTLYVMGEYFDFMGFFEIHAKSRHPIQAIYETYDNGRLIDVQIFNIAEYTPLF